MLIQTSPTLSASALSKWLGGIPPYPVRMAWCHSTDAFALRGLISSGEFTPRPCDVFNEDLLYFFYGRPAFRRNEQVQIAQSAKAPVVIVFSPSLVDAGRRVFPFDSGAFKDRYKNWVHQAMQLSDFELECSNGDPQRHVSAFFQNNSNYLKLIPKTPPKPYAGQFEVESLVAILTDPSAEKADDRRLAVELQVGQIVPFDSSTVVAVVIPDELEQAPWLQAFLATKGAGIEVIKYELAPLRHGGHYQALLEERTVKLHEDRGYL